MAKPACVEYFTLDQAAEFASGTFTHNFSTIHIQGTLWGDAGIVDGSYECASLTVSELLGTAFQIDLVFYLFDGVFGIQAESMSVVWCWESSDRSISRLPNG